MPAVKNLNRVFVPTITIGVIAAATNIILTNINIQPMSTKAWLACGFLSASLVAMFILGICTTIDQYFRLGFPFKGTTFELKKYVWVLWFIFGALINITLITSAAILMVELTMHHLASLPTHHSALIGKAAMGLVGSSVLHALFTIFSFIIWYGNFNRLLRNEGRNESTYSRQSDMVAIAAKGSGSLCELLLSWMFFAGGFFFTSLKLTNTINLHSHVLDQFIPITLFTTGLLFLLMSFMGGHPPSACSRTMHSKLSYITKGFKCYLDKKFSRERQLSSAIEASPRTPSNTKISSAPNIIIQSSQLSDQATIQQSASKITETQMEHKTSSSQIDNRNMNTPSTLDNRESIDEINIETPTTIQTIQTEAEEHETTKIALN